jgi:hypothetical protein
MTIEIAKMTNVMGNPPEVLKILEHARDLITIPANWTQRAAARDGDGFGTGALNEVACSFCSVGAILRAHGNLNHDSSSTVGHRLYSDAIFILSRGMSEVDANSTTVPQFNDTKTHSEVLQAFDITIEGLRKAIG